VKKKQSIAARTTDPESLFQQGYKAGFESVHPNWNKAFQLWLKAAEAGHIRAQFYLGTCYDVGRGAKRNLEKAYYWYYQSAIAGKMESQYNIGFFYRVGEVV
jgi:TPR repeat protein